MKFNVRKEREVINFMSYLTISWDVCGKPLLDLLYEIDDQEII